LVKQKLASLSRQSRQTWSLSTKSNELTRLVQKQKGASYYIGSAFFAGLGLSY
jgi:hypothetical protein